MKMSKAKVLVVTGAALLVMTPVLSSAATGASGGLIGTAHDFTLATGCTTNGGANATACDTAVPTGQIADGNAVGLCTFCHTPHKALQTRLLWNHTLSSANYSWDVPETTAGTIFPTISGQNYTGPTTKCLSCHDGSVAIGDIAWFGETSNTGAGALNKDQHNTGGEFQIATTAGAMGGNHPTAMPYPLGQADSTYNGTTTGAGATLTEFQPDPTSLTNTKIRLFHEDASGVVTAGTKAGNTGIECSSCHDPHNKATVDDLFLRGKLVGSSQADGYLCLQCHEK